MFFKTNKISYEEFDKEYRPLLISIAKDCMSKAKSMYSNPKYKQIEDKEYVQKQYIKAGVDKDAAEDIEEGYLHLWVFEDAYWDIIINVIDGQDAVCTEAGGHFLGTIEKYLNDKHKSKLTQNGKELITIDIGDGDEGCVCITFNRKYIGFKHKDIKYTPIKEGCVTFTNALENVKLV